MGGLLRQGDGVKFALVDAERAEHPVARTCAVLGVSRAGFYGIVVAEKA